MAKNGEKWRKMAKNGDGEFAFSICQIRHFAIGPPPPPPHARTIEFDHINLKISSEPAECGTLRNLPSKYNNVDSEEQSQRK